jgi:hypothetical protein
MLSRQAKHLDVDGRVMPAWTPTHKHAPRSFAALRMTVLARVPNVFAMRIT